MVVVRFLLHKRVLGTFYHVFWPNCLFHRYLMREEEREGEEKSNQKNKTSALKQSVSLFLDLLRARFLRLLSSERSIRMGFAFAN